MNQKKHTDLELPKKNRITLEQEKNTENIQKNMGLAIMAHKNVLLLHTPILKFR